MHPGDLSTKGGLDVDEHARVLGDHGPIPGLYAAGNTAAAPGVGDSYPGAGGTLGPAMVFGYVPAATPWPPRPADLSGQEGPYA